MIRQDWGLLSFSEAWRRQREIADAIVASHADDVLVTCEHHAVITRGRRTQADAMLVSTESLAIEGIEVVDVDRGGEATAHNPGQLVCYPVINLERYRPDLHWYLRMLEQSVIDTLEDFALPSGRVQGRTGVWIDVQRKICAIGIHCRSWVTTHGLALNVCNDLAIFGKIVPCGITDADVTSMTKELGRTVSIDDVKPVLLKNIEKYLEREHISH
jgi:lipoate-protein ligase B